MLLIEINRDAMPEQRKTPEARQMHMETQQMQKQARKAACLEAYAKAKRSGTGNWAKVNLFYVSPFFCMDGLFPMRLNH